MFVVSRVNIEFLGKEKIDWIWFVALDSNMQTINFHSVYCINIGTVVDKDINQLRISVITRKMERCETLTIINLFIDIR